jgi:multidrug efflux pump subunit AcrA (membrane-fusion protein)
VVSVPFSGVLESVSVKPNATVVAGVTELARLETRKLRADFARARAEWLGYLKRAAIARNEGDEGKAQVAELDARAVAAQMESLRQRIEEARIVAPIDGTVLTGEWEREVGRALEQGEVLFEIAPLGSLRAELAVPEDEIAEVEFDSTGELATAGAPDERIQFVVKDINPVAELVDEKNVFRVKVQLEEIPQSMRVGMEGVAQVSLGRRRYAWLWTRRLVNWLRMKFWL